MEAPKRQSIPFALSFALAFWAASAFTYTSVKHIINNELFISNLFWILLISFSLLLVLIVILIIGKSSPFVLLFTTAIFLGFALSIIAANNLNNQSNEILNLGREKYIFDVKEDQKVGSYYNTCVAEILNTDKKYKVKLQIDSSFEEVHAGDIIKANAKFSKAIDTQEDNYWQNSICANARITNPEKQERNDVLGPIFNFRNKLISTIRQYDWNESENISDVCALLGAIICGQRIDLNSGNLYTNFKSCGLAHLVAVSGAHLSLVTAILLIFLKKLKLKKWLIIFIQSAFIFAYLICAAIPISALRAAFMAYIAIFSFFGKRRPAPLNALGLCIIILIGVGPETSVSVSFALSAGSTIGIILFSSLFEYWILKPLPKCPEFISSALSLTFAANLCSQPLSVSIFTQLPLIAPLANIVCTPIFSLLCAGGLISSVFGAVFSQALPICTQILMFLSNCVSKLMCICINLLSSIPYASIPLTINIYLALFLTLVLCIVLYKTWPTKINFLNKANKPKLLLTISGLSLAIFALVFIISPLNSPTNLKALDVGQGDSLLLSSKGKNFLIDTGNQDNMLKTRFAENGITHLDGILITHPDDDHCGSLDIIEQLIVVDKIYIAKDLPLNSEDNCKKLMSQIRKIVSENDIVKLSVGDKIFIGEIELDVIWPDKFKDNGGNCDSLCLIANVDISNDGEIESRALLCGDAEKEEIDTLLKKRRIPKIDIYKCGHHGSANALTENGAKALSPKVTLISVGAKNKYGHPNSKIIEILKNTGSLIYRTDQQGTITINFINSKLNISTQK